jgi:serine/threonine protein kinase
LKRIESFAFSNTSLHSVELPSRITFIAANAFPTNCQLISPTLTHSIIFITWDIARQNGSDHPFEKIKPRHHLPLLSSFSTETDFPAAHPSFNLKHFPIPVARDCLNLFLSELEPFLILNHRCICPLAGVLPPTRTNGPILAVEFPSQTSLADLLSNPWERWWIATTKSIVLTGIVLAMIHAHDRDVLHGNLNPNCILLDDNHRPKLCDFGIKQLSRSTQQSVLMQYLAPEIRESLTTKADVFAFSLILYEVVVNKREEVVATEVKDQLEQVIAISEVGPENRWSLPNVPIFVAKLIVRGLARNPAERPSIEDIFDEFEKHDFKILPGVDSAEVRAFAEWVEEPQTD